MKSIPTKPSVAHPRLATRAGTVGDPIGVRVHRTPTGLRYLADVLERIPCARSGYRDASVPESIGESLTGKARWWP